MQKSFLTNSLGLASLFTIGIITLWLAEERAYLWLSSSSGDWLLDVDGALFSVRFVHSIHRTPVVEEIEIDGDELLVYQTVYESFGVGMPDDQGLGFKYQRGRGFVLDLERRLPELVWWVTELAKQSLILPDRTYPLRDFAAEGEMLRFRGRTARRFDVLRSKFGKGRSYG